MAGLDRQIANDEIGQQLLKEGNTPDDIRMWFEEEGERVAQEIEDEMEEETGE